MNLLELIYRIFSTLMRQIARINVDSMKGLNVLLKLLYQSKLLCPIDEYEGNTTRFYQKKKKYERIEIRH